MLGIIPHWIEDDLQRKLLNWKEKGIVEEVDPIIDYELEVFLHAND